MKHDRVLDCIGLYCPMPIVHAAREMKTMREGEVLLVLSDDKGIKLDMPAWCRSTGNEFLGIEQDGEVYKVYVRKKEES